MDRSGELTWEIARSEYSDVVLHYTCREVDVGAIIAVNLDEAGQTWVSPTESRSL